MQLPQRDRYEGRIRGRLRNVFRAAKKATTRRQPGWRSLERELVKKLEPVLEQITATSARRQSRQFGQGPRLTPDIAAAVTVSARKRAADLAADLIEVSKRRWAEIKRPRTNEDIANWRRINFGEARVKAIALTETTIAHQAGENLITQQLKRKGVKLSAVWRNGLNPCPICEALNGKPERVWRRKFPKGPPAHVNCNCYLDHS